MDQISTETGTHGFTNPQKSTRQFDWSKASLAFSIGGTSVRCFAIDARGEVDETPIFDFSWKEYIEQLESLPEGLSLNDVMPCFINPESDAKDGQLFLEYLALSVNGGLASRGVLPENLVKVGISIAGIVDGGSIKPNNVPIDLSGIDALSDLPATFSAVLSMIGKPFNLDQIHVINDSEAALRAEQNSHHGGLKEGTGASLIMGTGFNGQVVIDHEVDPRFKELGYTMLVNSSGEVIMTSWDRIEENAGLYDSESGRILSSPSGYRYIENLLAGVGLSVSFFDFIMERGQKDLLIRSPQLFLAFKEYEKLDVTSLFKKVSSLSDKKGKFDKANEELTRILNEDLDTELGFEVKEFFEKTGRVLGNALKTLKKESGRDDLKFVFSGGIADSIKGIACFWDAVTKASGTSSDDIRHTEYVNGGVREAYAFSE